MPPKGWRKNAEGQYPLQHKDLDLTSIDDILFPRATVQKLAKQLLSTNDGEDSNSIMAKDSVIALQRSATVFVSHIMFHARQISKEHSRKTVNAQDVLLAIEKADFPGFVPDVKQKLAGFEQQLEVKKKYKKLIQKSSNQDEQEAKRGKTNDATTIKKAQEDDDADATVEASREEDDEEEEAGDGNGEDDVEGEEDDEGEEDEDEAIRTQNPISLLEREEKELTQDVDESVVEDQDEDEDGDED